MKFQLTVKHHGTFKVGGKYLTFPTSGIASSVIFTSHGILIAYLLTAPVPLS